MLYYPYPASPRETSLVVRRDGRTNNDKPAAHSRRLVTLGTLFDQSVADPARCRIPSLPKRIGSLVGLASTSPAHIPTISEEINLRFAMAGQMQSTGRGGAGNIGDVSNSPRLGPKDLETPTLKKPVITTGRGGSGNMTPNKDPAETRARQDVAP